MDAKAIVAANMPVYGEVSYDRAINTILQRKEQETEREHSMRKCMALLLRKTEGETEEEILCRDVMQKIKDYVKALELNTIDVRFDEESAEEIILDET